MGLKQAITEIAGQMEEEAKGETIPGKVIGMYARMLRTAVQAAGDEISIPDQSAKDAERLAKSLARQEQIKAEAAEKRQGARMVTFADGPHKGDLVEIPWEIPDGARTAEFGGVHELRHGKWHYIGDGKD